MAAETWRAVAKEGDEIEFEVDAGARTRAERMDIEALARMFAEGGVETDVEKLRQMKMVGPAPLTFTRDPATKAIRIRQ
jgi:hypothetical protein